MKTPFVRIFTVALAAGLLLNACSDDDPMMPDPDPDPDTALTNPSFSTDIQAIFTARGCTQSQCHGATPGQADLNLTADSAYAELVGVAAMVEPEFVRVVPDSADVSYLMIKLRGTQSVGNQMPVGGAVTTVDSLNVRNWINTGAPNN